MTPRLHVASQIYAQLVLQDLAAAVANPIPNARRALLFADALLLCDQQSSPTGSEAETKPSPTIAAPLLERRGHRPMLH